MDVAAAGLADEAVGLARPDLERHPAQDGPLDPAEPWYLVPVVLLTCPSLISGGYIIANLPETSLKTGDAIFSALSRITDQDIRASAAGGQLDRVAATAPPRRALAGPHDETARKITERKARQAAQRAGTKAASSQAPLADAIGEIFTRHTEEGS